MSTIGELAETLNEAPHDLYEESVRQSLYEILDFLDTLPQELDLASAAYYLRKEFKRNDTGVDDRVQIFTFDPEPADDEGYWDSSGYDLDDDYDEDAVWREDYY